MTNRITQVAKLTALTANSDVRVGQVAKLTALQASSDVRIGQVARLTALQNTSQARISQVSRLVAIKPNFSNLGSFVSANDKTSSSTISTTSTAEINTNEIAIVILASDNDATSDSITTLHSSVTIDGYSATKIREYTKGGGASDAGATVSAWYLVAPTNILSGSTITASLSSSKTAKAITGHLFQNNTSSQVTIDGILEQAGTNNSLASMSVSGTNALDHIWIRAIASESDTTTTGLLNTTTSWSQILQSSTTGSTSTTNIIATGEFAFKTGTDSGASDPAFINGTTTDNANILFGLAIVTSQTYDEIASGGVSANSSAAPQVVSQYTMSGGINVGFSSATFTYDEMMVAGVSVSGESSTFSNTELLLEGGVMVSGFAEITSVSQIEFSSGASVAGEGLYGLVYDESVSGGILLSGSHISESSQSEIMQGGIVLIGTLDVSLISEQSTSGGAIVSGESYNAIAKNEIMIGGIENSGSHLLQSINNVSSQGGAKIRGGSMKSLFKAPKRVLPKFVKGEKVFVRCSKLCCHVLQTVKRIDKNQNTFIYDCGIGSFAERNILSIEEFARLKGTPIGNALCVRRS